MGDVKKALHYQREAERKRALAPSNDPVRFEFDQKWADALEEDAKALLSPDNPLEMGSGGEIIPPSSVSASGLEVILRKPDLLNLGASTQRTDLIEKAGVLDLAVETSHQSNAKGPIQKMITHQLASAHKRALELMAEAASIKDPELSTKKDRAAAKMMEAFSRGALTLQRLQTGASQVVMVQHLQVNGPAVIGNVTTRGG